MNEHPIIFSTKMVQAILDGRKTQTRMVCKYYLQEYDTVSKTNTFDFHHQDGPGMIEKCPYGQPGDVLWVRETWQAMNTRGLWWHEVPREERHLWNWAWTNKLDPAYEHTPPKWLQSIFMPRAACRLQLKVVDVRVERLHDITWRDCLKEGVPLHYSDPLVEDHAIMMFGNLWNSINSKRGYGWNVNPLVWVVEFRRSA